MRLVTTQTYANHMHVKGTHSVSTQQFVVCVRVCGKNINFFCVVKQTSDLHTEWVQAKHQLKTIQQ